MTAAFQDVFALLLVHTATRQQYLQDVQGFCARYDGETAGLLRALNVEDLKASAHNLLLKRGGHIRDLVPTLTGLLGERFWPLITAHANTCLVEGHDKHRADALVFCRGLAADANNDVTRQAQRDAVFLAAGVSLVQRTPENGPLPLWSVRASPLTVGRAGRLLAVGRHGRVAWSRVF